MKKITTKPVTRNGVLILLLTSLAIGVIVLSKDITPAQQRVEKVIDSKNFTKS